MWVRSKHVGRSQPLRIKPQLGELEQQVVVSVVVQDAGAVNVRACGDQEVRGRCGSLVALTAKLALGLERGVLDRVVDPKTRQSQQVRKQLGVVGPVAGVPASFEQKRSADRDRAVLHHLRDLPTPRGRE